MLRRYLALDEDLGLQIWLSLIIGTATIMVGNQQKLLLLGLIDEVPSLECVLESVVGIEGQRHGAIVPFAIDGFGKTLEAFHQDDL